MVRRMLPLVFCVFSLAANAIGTGDIAITSFTADKATALTGETVRLTIRLKNNGPDDAIDVNLNFGNTYGERLAVLAAASSGGWQCSSIYMNCWTPTFPAGSEVALTLDVATPPTVRPASFAIDAAVSSGNDFTFANNRATVPVALQPSSRIADLLISLSAPPDPIAENTPVMLLYDVRNAGPQDLGDIRVPIQVPGTAQPMTFGGNGWTCVVHTASDASCLRPFLTAGANAPLEVRVTMPSHPAQIATQTAVFAAQAHVDPNPSNQQASRTIFVGTAADWSRILLPITETNVPGANGSLWKTEITGFIDPASNVTIEPLGCGGLEDPCQLPPVGRSFDVRHEDLIVDQFGSQFIYVSRATASGFVVSTRVHDASRSGETSGAVLPSPRDDDFSEQGFTLIGIPVGQELRARLRIYDYDGKDAARVEVALYGDQEAEPFYRDVHRLFSEPGLFTLTTALLPSHPASTQIDLSALIPAGRYSRVRAGVRPFEEHLKVWGVVSITNNSTSHVTVLTP